MPGAVDLLDERILVVDDLETDARLMQAMLEGSGYRNVTTQTDSREVRALHEKNRYALILLDVQMPHMDGFDVMAALQELGDDYLPVVVVTAAPDHMKRALDAGAKDFIGKPVRMAELLARARNVLHIGVLLREAKARNKALEERLDAKNADLRESEELFRLLAENVPEAILIRGIADRAYRYINAAVPKLFGCPVSAGDPIEKGFDAMHPEDRAEVLAELERSPAGGMNREVRFVHPDGSQRWGHVRTFSIDKSGEPLWLAGILEDITERKATEEALREAETRFRALVEQSIAGIYTVEHGYFTYANPRLCEMLGYTVEELRGLEMLELLDAADRPLLLENRRKREAGDETAMVGIYRLRRKDGGLLCLAVDGKYLTVKGRRVFLGMGQDVTERVRAAEALRESEEKYRLLWETTSDVVILLDDDMRIRYANPSVQAVFGYSPAEVEGQPISMLQPLRMRETHARALDRYLSAGMKNLDWRATELLGMHRDGREVPLEVVFSHMVIGGRSTFAGFMRDITQRKRGQAALEMANSRLQALSRRVLEIQEDERRSISRELHDDVGQSLLALRMGLHRLVGHSDGRDSALLAHCIEVSDAVQEKLRELSVQLTPPQLEQLGVQDALRWLVSRQRAMTGLAIACEFGPEPGRLPAEVESACYRICQEALNNATRHGQAKNITVALAADPTALVLAIRDDGIGFDELPGRERALLSGSLGLISMEERARFAGGRLELQTGPGAGTCVRAIFPR
jgi:PAS domain S-box-containing protein